MKKMKHAVMIFAVILGAAALLGACGNGDGEEKDTAGDCDAGNEGVLRCEDNIVEECTENAWVPKSDCTATGLLCGVDEDGTTACGNETALCDGADVEQLICLDDVWLVMCNVPDGHPIYQLAGDYLYVDCADFFTAIDPASPPGECFDYGDTVVTQNGPWGADCLAQEGSACAHVNPANAWVRLGCGENGELDPNLACDQFLGCVPVEPAGFCEQSGLTCEGNNLVACQVPDVFGLGWNLADNISFACDDSEYGSGICDSTGYDDGTNPPGPACVHETVGGYCDDNVVLCGGTLTCDPPTATCQQ